MNFRSSTATRREGNAVSSRLAIASASVSISLSARLRDEVLHFAANGSVIDGLIRADRPSFRKLTIGHIAIVTVRRCGVARSSSGTPICAISSSSRTWIWSPSIAPFCHQDLRAARYAGRNFRDRKSVEG